MNAQDGERRPRRAIDPDAHGPDEASAGGGWFWAIVGPPWMAAKRAGAALQERFGAVFARWAEAWRNLFLGQEQGEDVEVTPPVATALLLATVVVALTMYSWPLRDILPAPLFVVLAVAVLIGAFVTIRKASMRGSGQPWERGLRATQRRVGMVWWERLGALLALAGVVAAAILEPTVLPVAVGALLGFGVLLVQPPDARELRTVRQLPRLPEPELDPDQRGEDGEWTLPEGYVERNFAWSVHRAFGTDSHELTVQLHEPTYTRTKRLNPGHRWEGEVPRFDVYVVDGSTPDVERAASALSRLSRGRSYSTYEEVSLALALVQSIEYKTDLESTGKEEYWRYPIETLYDETGDCEDLTILAAAVLRRLGHAVVVLLLPGHAALGVEVPTGLPGRFVQHSGQRYYYCETTAKGWEVGEIPKDYIEADVHIVPIAAFT